MTDDELDQVAAQYPLCRRLHGGFTGNLTVKHGGCFTVKIHVDEDHAVILQPLTFGRWRVSRATKWAVLDGY